VPLRDFEAEAPVVDRSLIADLAPHPGERLLDVGTGTGAVALRAARAGANVTGVDLAPALIDTARRLARTAGLSIRFDVADAERLPYPDASFDVVCSVLGVVFAPDHTAATRELARVCRPAGRLGIVAWRPGPGGDGFDRMLARFSPPPRTGPKPGDWGRPEHASALLGDTFDLEFVPGVWIQTGESGEAIWGLLTTCSPPFKDLVASLDGPTCTALHAAWVDYFERYRHEDKIRAPNEYMLILGTRTTI
jgi:SAM-dependent methyltransferase